MSDGPYKSLNMSRAWKKFAEWAYKPAFEIEEVAGLVIPALEESWREEDCGDVVRALKTILGGERQIDMFGASKMVELEAARRELAAGSPMRRLIVDHTIKAVAEGKTGLHAIQEGIQCALQDRAARVPRQAEEHFLRKHSTESIATRQRTRMESAIAIAPISSLARRLSGLDKAAPVKTVKHQDIEDGARL